MTATEIWMWGREEAIGMSFYWLVHHKVLRNGIWVWDIPYSCRPEAFARETADKMTGQSSIDGRFLYREVVLTGPHVEWQSVAWKYRDEWKATARESKSEKDHP